LDDPAERQAAKRKRDRQNGLEYVQFLVDSQSMNIIRARAAKCGKSLTAYLADMMRKEAQTIQRQDEQNTSHEYQSAPAQQKSDQLISDAEHKRQVLERMRQALKQL
jgi:hypothetical protein